MLVSVSISIVLGVLFLLITFFSKKNYKVRAVLAILGVSLIFYGSYTYGTLEPVPIIETYDVASKRSIEYPVSEVQIISPVEGDVVKCRILSMGVYPENHDKDIWVLLKPTDNKYYPQSDWTNTSYKEDGKWQVVTRFGGNAEEKFELIVYETDEQASQYFSKIVEAWKSEEEYPGLNAEDLPTGAKEVDKIEVSLENDCRGIF
jgi:hypothetical protein